MPAATEQAFSRLPKAQGLYDPAREKDNCGVGMIANLKRAKSHRIVKNALQVLERMEHRGGCGCEVNTGDGSGALFAIPDAFYRGECKDLGVELPPEGQYGTGLMFFAKEPGVFEACKAVIEKHCADKGFDVLLWRDVPTDNASLGPSSLACEPDVKQIFVAPKQPLSLSPEMLETELMILRRCVSVSGSERVVCVCVCARACVCVCVCVWHSPKL